VSTTETTATEPQGLIHISPFGKPAKWVDISPFGKPAKWVEARTGSTPNFEAHEDQTGFWQDIKWEAMTKEEQNLYKQQYPVV
jgi:hypothetical protein